MQCTLTARLLVLLLELQVNKAHAFDNAGLVEGLSDLSVILYIMACCFKVPVCQGVERE